MKSIWSDLPIRIGVTYTVLGVLWIVLSDRIALLLVSDSSTLTMVQTYKGWGFVGISALVMVILLRIEIRRRTTEHLKSTEQLNRLLMAVEGSGEVMFITDTTGIITYINPAFTTVYGHTSAEVVGRVTPRILKSDETPIEQHLRLWEHLTAGRQFAAEIVNKAKDGRRVHIETSLNPIKGKDDRVTGFLAIQRDVTSRAKLENQLYQAQRLESLGTLAAGIAHDFNNILGIVLGFAHYVKKNVDDRTKTFDAISSIEDAVDRGRGVTSRLLSFASKSDSEMELLSVNDVIRDFIKLTAETFPKTIEVVAQLHDGIPVIHADRTGLNQILLNLLVNARDAIDGSGQITISTDAQAGRNGEIPNDPTKSFVHIAVADTGRGMGPHIQSHIFEPFFTTKDNGKGTGLGLAVTFGIVRSHCGWIDVQSERGKGTVFHVYLPAGESLQPRKHDPSVEHRPAVGTETILIIEDEDDLRKLLGIVLQELGYRVLSAGNGEDGLAHFKANPDEIQIVVTDLDMPGMSGLEVSKALKKLKPSLHVIVTTGYLDGSIRENIKTIGVSDIIQKPYLPDEIATSVRRLLDTSLV